MRCVLAESHAYEMHKSTEIGTLGNHLFQPAWSVVAVPSTSGEIEDRETTPSESEPAATRAGKKNFRTLIGGPKGKHVRGEG